MNSLCQIPSDLRASVSDAALPFTLLVSEWWEMGMPWLWRRGPIGRHGWDRMGPAIPEIQHEKMRLL